MFKILLISILIIPSFISAQSTRIIDTDSTQIKVEGYQTTVTNKVTKEQEVFTLVEKIPKPDYDLQEYISNNLVYPAKAKENFISGKVAIKFIVLADGSIDSAHIIKSVSNELDSEALRVINSMPPWQPGEQDGQTVAVYHSLPVTFARQDVFTLVEKMPMPEYNVSQFISKNIRYPKEAMKQGVQGRVAVKFVIDSTGHIKGVTIAGRPQPLLDSEAIRLVSSLPPWKPGTQNGKPVNVYYVIPVTFRF